MVTQLKLSVNHSFLPIYLQKDAHRPGMNIFQSGAFLGNFDYDSQNICIAELPKIVQAHAWGSGKI